MKWVYALLVFACINGCASSAPLSNSAPTDPGVVHHPAPTEPRLIASGLLPEFKKSLTLPPEAGSDNQGRDEEELFAAQKTRTAEDCARANTEVKVTLAGFFGKPYGPLAAGEVVALDSFFDQIRNDGDYYIQLLKKEFPRPRPFTYLKELAPCVPREVTGAYPSGHATLARLYALILGDLYPERKKDFGERAEVIARDRIVGGGSSPDRYSRRKRARGTDLRENEAFSEVSGDVRGAREAEIAERYATR